MTLKVLYYNCQGLTSESRVNEFEKTLDKINRDIAGLSKIRMEGEFLSLMSKSNNGNYSYYFGTSKAIEWQDSTLKFNYTGHIAQERGKWYKLVKEWTPRNH